jgi:hypothetical protein
MQTSMGFISREPVLTTHGQLDQPRRGGGGAAPGLPGLAATAACRLRRRAMAIARAVAMSTAIVRRMAPVRSVKARVASEAPARAARAERQSCRRRRQRRCARRPASAAWSLARSLTVRAGDGGAMAA